MFDKKIKIKHNASGRGNPWVLRCSPQQLDSNTCVVKCSLCDPILNTFCHVAERLSGDKSVNVRHLSPPPPSVSNLTLQCSLKQ